MKGVLSLAFALKGYLVVHISVNERKRGGPLFVLDHCTGLHFAHAKHLIRAFVPVGKKNGAAVKDAPFFVINVIVVAENVT